MDKSAQIIVLPLALLAIFNVFVWYEILSKTPARTAQIYFIDVGQGDAELAILPNNIKVLIDGGPNNRIIKELDSVLSPTDRYLDLVILSHPQLDHYGGLIDVFKRYSVGAFISDGKKSDVPNFHDLEKVIADSKTKMVVIGEGDAIKYGEDKFDILSPSPALLHSTNPNDWVLVLKFQSQGARALFTGDIRTEIEDAILKNHDIGTDILKVSHHGSKFSSSPEFLNAAKPMVSVIEVGKNSYGHPTPQTLGRLAQIGSQIFRTDKDGTIKLQIAGAKINIYKQK